MGANDKILLRHATRTVVTEVGPEDSGYLQITLPSANGTLTANPVATPMTTQGDILVGDAAGEPARLAMGTALQTLRVNAAGTTEEWANPTPMTAAGDVIYGGVAGLATRLPIGTSGQVLRVNAGATALAYTSPSVGVTSAAIDVHTQANSTVVLPYAATNSFIPTHVVVTCTVGMTGDAHLIFGTTAGGAEIQANTTMTGLTTAGQRWIIPITGKVVADIAGNATLHVRVDTIDTTVAGRVTVSFYGLLV